MKKIVSNQILIAYCVLLACLVLSLGVPPATVRADNTASVVGSVTVVSIGSYGARVVDSATVLWEREVLGQPDKRGAWIFERGWISIELKSTVKKCKGISIWAVRLGWRAPHFDVYASTDGKRWRLIGTGTCSSSSYVEYTFAGTYGDVRYLKVNLEEIMRWLPAIMTLDAVQARGGDD